MINTRKYWENEVIRALSGVDKNAFGYISLVGSVNPNHDIDLATLPSPNTQISYFYDQNHLLLKNLEDSLRTQGRVIAPFPSIDVQDEVGYLSKANILLHNLIFLDSPSFKKFNPEKFREALEKQGAIYGSLDVLDSPELQKRNYSSLIWTLIRNDRSLSNYPESLFSVKTAHILWYVLKYGLNLKKDLKGKRFSPEEAHNQFVGLIHELETIN